MSGLNQSANRSDVLDTSFISGSITVGNTDQIAAVGVSNLAGRQTLVLYNDSNRDMFYGPAGVTNTGANKGILFSSQESVTLNVGEYIIVHVVCSNPGGNKVIVQEFA